MTNLASAPWPWSIRAYFPVDANIPEVPAFMHKSLEYWTKKLSIFRTFEWADIRIVDGAVLLRVENEEIYVNNFRDILEPIMEDLTKVYNKELKTND